MQRALVAGDVLRPGASNLQSDETACCRSCLADDRCTAWVYCPDPAGCNATEAAAAAAAAGSTGGTAAPVRRDSAGAPAAASPEAEEEAEGRSLYLPHNGCRLLSIPAFRLRKDSPQVVAKGEGVPYISGADCGEGGWVAQSAAAGCARRWCWQRYGRVLTCPCRQSRSRAALPARWDHGCFSLLPTFANFC